MANTIKKTAKPGPSEILLAALFALVVLAVVFYVRVRLIGMPFGREEGEYAYSGQLILKGLSPYLHASTLKLPGMAYLYAFFMLCFGKSVMAIRLGLLLTNILAVLLLFFIGRKLYGRTAGLLAAAVFGITSLSHHLLGTFAHATHFIILFVLAAYLCIIGENKPLSPYRYLLAGILLGCGFLVKQHAIIFLLAGAVAVLFNARPLRVAAGNIIVMVFGFILPYATLLLLVLKQGAFSNFWFWTVSYASPHQTWLTPLQVWVNFKSQLIDIFASMLSYWVLGLIGLILLLARRDKRELAFTLPLLLAAFLAICPEGLCRPDSFMLVAPVIALLAGVVVSDFAPAKNFKRLILIAFLAALSFQLWSEGWFLFTASPQAYLEKTRQAVPEAGARVLLYRLKSET